MNRNNFIKGYFGFVKYKQLPIDFSFELKITIFYTVSDNALKRDIVFCVDRAGIYVFEKSLVRVKINTSRVATFAIILLLSVLCKTVFIISFDLQCGQIPVSLILKHVVSFFFITFDLRHFQM